MNAFDAIVVGLAVAALISIVVTSLRVGTPPMPSSRKAQKAIISAIPHDTHGLIFDLGSGWGNVIFSLARSFPLATIRGVELSLVPWAVSRIGASLFGYSNLDIQRGNFQDISLDDAEVVVCFLWHDIFENQIRRRIETQYPYRFEYVSISRMGTRRSHHSQRYSPNPHLPLSRPCQMI